MNDYLKKYKGFLLGIISTTGFIACSIILSLSRLRSGIYVYDYSTTVMLNKILTAGRICLILLSVLSFLLFTFYLRSSYKKESLMLVMFGLIFSISIYGSYLPVRANHTLYTLIDPVIVNKVDKDNIIIVESSNHDRRVSIKVTEVEYTLLPIGKDYASIVYIGNNESGILQYIKLQ